MRWTTDPLFLSLWGEGALDSTLGTGMSEHLVEQAGGPCRGPKGSGP